MNRMTFVTRLLLGGALAFATPSRAAPAGRDLGAAPPDTPMRVVVSLPWADRAGFEAALRARYTVGNPLFHRWMSRAEIAGYGPGTAAVAAVRTALSGSGLAVTRASASGSTLFVSGTAAAMARAFGTPIHLALRDGHRVAWAPDPARPRGSLAGRVTAVSGLSAVSMASQFARRPARAAPRTVPAATSAPSPGALPADRFTDRCFGPAQQVRLQGSNGTATWSGLTYLPGGTAECAYSPGQIATHYGLDQVYDLGIQGQGQTIVIVGDAASPRAIEDADTYFADTGAPLFTADTFQMIAPFGTPATEDEGWASETVTQMELAHAIAPGARIVLAVAQSRQTADLQAINQYVIDRQVGNVIVDDFGSGERELGAPAVAAWDLLSQEAAAQGIALVAPSGNVGDMSAVEGSPDVISPADGSYATAVGGTSLGVPDGSGVVETGWGDRVAFLGTVDGPAIPPQRLGGGNGSGGGISGMVAKPDWQSDRPGGFRQLPDLALIGDPYTGTFAFWTPSEGGGGYSSIGGTSVSAVVFGAMWALMNQGAGYSARTGQFRPGSSFGAAAPQLRAFQSDLLIDGLPVDGEGETELDGSLTTPDGSSTTLSGFAAVGLPDDPAALAVLDMSNGFDALTFDTDIGLSTTPGFDFTTGRGIPNGAGAVALGLRLFAGTN